MSFNGLTSAEAERLALLAEELGESIQIIGKVLRHGYESHHPDGGPSNRELLEKELGDVQCALRIMYGHDDLQSDQVEHNATLKGISVQKYLHHNPEFVKE